MYGDGRPALRLDFSARSGYVAAMTRHVDFEKIENFRDFGDYPTRHGRRMPKGRFYRSANHHSASAEDLAVLSRLSPSHIVDLREKVERDREPSARWPGFKLGLWFHACFAAGGRTPRTSCSCLAGGSLRHQAGALGSL